MKKYFIASVDIEMKEKIEILFNKMKSILNVFNFEYDNGRLEEVPGFIGEYLGIEIIVQGNSDNEIPDGFYLSLENRRSAISYEELESNSENDFFKIFRNGKDSPLGFTDISSNLAEYLSRELGVICKESKA